MIERTYYCLSCKKLFKRVAKKRSVQKCMYCHSSQYVRDSTKGDKVPFNAVKAHQHSINRMRKMGLLLQKQKFKLVFEHNIVEAMRKYVPNKEAFIEVLKLAKKETVKEKNALYKELKRQKAFKSESDIGFKF